MAKKYIGIDFGQKSLRVVTATLAKGVPVFTGVSERQAETAMERCQCLNELLDGVAFGDVVAASLHMVGSYCRQLEFPFSEANKIEPAVALEMGAQLPTSDGLVCDFLKPRPHGKVFSVPAAAVRRDVVTDMLALFQEAEQPLHLLDLSLFAYVAALAETIATGVLAVIVESEVTVAHVKDGQVISFRTMPRRAQDSVEHIASMIQGYCRTLVRDGDTPPPLFLMGEGAGNKLLSALQGVGFDPQYPSLKFEGQQMEPSLLPAAALALRATISGRNRPYNFLKGDLAPRNEWEGFRLRLIAIGVLLGLTIILGAAGAYINYGQQQKQAESLKGETLAIFRQTFPDVHTIVDVPNQMQANLVGFREKVRLLGVGQNRSVLNVLREVSSRLPADISFDVREFIYNGEQLHIDGSASSFDEIKKFSQALEASPLFEKVQIVDAKMGLDGGRVDFNLNVKNSAEELAQ